MDRRAFTLIELLVSMAVIAILLALAIPAIWGARDAAKRVECLAQLQGFGRAFTLYRNDNDEMLPYAEYPIALARGFLDPLVALEAYLGHPVPQIDENGLVHTGGPYSCPADAYASERGVSYDYPPYEVMAAAGLRTATQQYIFQPNLPIFQDHGNFHTGGVAGQGEHSIEARNVLLINGSAAPFDIDRNRFPDF